MIPLIRTEGKPFAKGETLDPAAFVRLPDLRRANKTDTTRQVEADFSLDDCLYFFAGHACPDFGDIVLLYSQEMADQSGGGATPFDTGGLHAGFIRVTLEGETPAEYCRRNSCSLSEWRAKADQFIAAHFASEADYLRGVRPKGDDGSHRLDNAENSRRAWTWEIRLHRDHPIDSDLKRVWMSADCFEAVRQKAITSNGEKCLELITGNVIRRAGATETPHMRAEAEAASW